MDNYFSRYVQLALSGDNSAFEALYNLTKDTAYFTAFNIVKDDQAALDIIQESYIIAFENLHTLESHEFFDIWLNSIVSSVIKRTIIQSEPELFDYNDIEGEVEWDDEESPERLPKESVDDKLTRNTIIDIVDSLANDSHLLILMYYYLNMDVDTIASSLSISVNAVRYKLTAAKKIIKSNLERLSNDGTFIQPVTIAAIPSAFADASKMQFLFHPAPAFSNVIAIDSDSEEENNEESKSDYEEALNSAIAAAAAEQNEKENVIAIDSDSEEENNEESKSNYEEALNSAIAAAAAEQNEKEEEEKRDTKPGDLQITMHESQEEEPENIRDVHKEAKPEKEADLTKIGEFHSIEHKLTLKDKILEFMQSTKGKVTVVAIAAFAIVAATVIVITSINIKKSSANVNTGASESSITESSEEDGHTGTAQILEDVDNFKYSVNDDGTLTITSYVGDYSNVFIPFEINGKSVTKIKAGTFKKGGQIRTITIPKSVREIEITSSGKTPFNDCIYLSSIRVNEDNEYFTTEDGVLFNKDMSELIFFPAGKNDISSYTVPDTVTKIGHSAFYDSSLLESVIIPDTVKSIGDYAFYECLSLKEITIPKGVKSIGKSLFYGCADLEKVTLQNGITEIGSYAFKGCSSLRSIELPNGVTSIDKGAFKECAILESITIPGSVNSIFTPESDEKGNVTEEEDAVFYHTHYVVISGKSGSYAESFAKKSKISFKAI